MGPSEVAFHQHVISPTCAMSADYAPSLGGLSGYLGAKAKRRPEAAGVEAPLSSRDPRLVSAPLRSLPPAGTPRRLPNRRLLAKTISLKASNLTSADSHHKHLWLLRHLYISVVRTPRVIRVTLRLPIDAAMSMESTPECCPHQRLKTPRRSHEVSNPAFQVRCGLPLVLNR